MDPVVKIPVKDTAPNETPVIDIIVDDTTVDDIIVDNATIDIIIGDATDAPVDHTTVKSTDPDGDETDRDIFNPPPSFGPRPELPEELARQWGYTDDSYKKMRFHRCTPNGWVLMKEPVDDFSRRCMGLPPLPHDIAEVRCEERRQEELKMLSKKHGIAKNRTCGRCRDNGKNVRSHGPWMSCFALTPCL